MNEHECSRCQHSLCVAKVSIFKRLDRDNLLEIIRLTKHKSYKKGDYLINEGDNSSTLFIINEGIVKLVKNNTLGKEQIIRIQKQGTTIGEYYLFSDYQPYNFSAIALSDLKICCLEKKDMDYLLNKHPHLSKHLLIELSNHLIETQNLVQNLSTLETDSKISFVIKELANHFGTETDSGIIINNPLTREEMANYAGLTRETISRKLSQFSNEGYLEFPNNKTIIIKDLSWFLLLEDL